MAGRSLELHSSARGIISPEVVQSGEFAHSVGQVLQRDSAKRLRRVPFSLESTFSHVGEGYYRAMNSSFDSKIYEAYPKDEKENIDRMAASSISKAVELPHLLFLLTTTADELKRVEQEQNASGRVRLHHASERSGLFYAVTTWSEKIKRYALLKAASTFITQQENFHIDYAFWSQKPQVGGTFDATEAVSDALDLQEALSAAKKEPIKGETYYLDDTRFDAAVSVKTAMTALELGKVEVIDLNEEGGSSHTTRIVFDSSVTSERFWDLYNRALQTAAKVTEYDPKLRTKIKELAARFAVRMKERINPTVDSSQFLSDVEARVCQATSDAMRFHDIGKVFVVDAQEDERDPVTQAATRRRKFIIVSPNEGVMNLFKGIVGDTMEFIEANGITGGPEEERVAQFINAAAATERQLQTVSDI